MARDDRKEREFSKLLSVAEAAVEMPAELDHVIGLARSAPTPPSDDLASSLAELQRIFGGSPKRDRAELQEVESELRKSESAPARRAGEALSIALSRRK
jgi:hypothetical protein